jgi:hypothetical protein
MTDTPTHGRPTVAFGAPYERGGATVITASSSTSHTVDAGSCDAGRAPAAEMAGVRPRVGAFEVRDDRVR